MRVYPKKYHLWLSFFWLWHGCSVWVSAEIVAKNAIHYEFFGSGYQGSINYERLLTRDFSFRVGIGYSTTETEHYIGMRHEMRSDGKWRIETQLKKKERYIYLPLTVSHIIGHRRHKLEIGGGLLSLFYDATAEGWTEEYKTDAYPYPSSPLETKLDDNFTLRFDPYHLYYLAIFGYRYQPERRRVLFRFTYTPIIPTSKKDANNLFWFGLSLGYFL